MFVMLAASDLPARSHDVFSFRVHRAEQRERTSDCLGDRRPVLPRRGLYLSRCPAGSPEWRRFLVVCHGHPVPRPLYSRTLSISRKIAFPFMLKPSPAIADK